MGVSDRVRNETLDVFDEGDEYTPLTASEVAEEVGVSRRTAYERLQCLVDHGDIETKKVGARGRVWWRSPMPHDEDAIERSGSEATIDREFEEVLDRINAGFFAVDEEFRFIYLNEQMEQLVGGSKEELHGRCIWDVFPEAVDTNFSKKNRMAMDTGVPVTYEEYYPPLDNWFECHTYPSETGLSVYFYDISERKKREEMLDRQRDQLATLTRLNDVIRDISLTAVAATSREEIEQQICEKLIKMDPYVFAWVGRVSREQPTVTPDAAAGFQDGYLEEIEITIDDTATSQGPTGRAIQTGNPQFVQDTLNDPMYEPWRETASERGYRSSTALPMEHDGVFYGVLNVYAEEPNAFTGPEIKMLEQLGELVGHAIQALEQRKALISNTITILEFRITDTDHPLLEISTDGEFTIIFERRIPVHGDRYIQFITVRGISSEEFEAAIKKRSIVTNVECIAEREDESFFEVSTESSPVAEVLAAYGGQLQRVTTTGEAFRVLAEVPSDADIREILDEITEIYSGAELLNRKPAVRSRPNRQELHSVITDKLTNKQQAALEAAYFAGYFEQPRTNTGEEVAELMDRSASTFTQHIRSAQRKLFEAIFENQTTTV
jgi:HTH-type transcriptional regulator, bacterioopsin transcriptional activator and related proteins